MKIAYQYLDMGNIQLKDDKMYNPIVTIAYEMVEQSVIDDLITEFLKGRKPVLNVNVGFAMTGVGDQHVKKEGRAIAETRMEKMAFDIEHINIRQVNGRIKTELLLNLTNRDEVDHRKNTMIEISFVSDGLGNPCIYFHSASPALNVALYHIAYR